MELKVIYKPIEAQLSKVEVSLKSIIGCYEMDPTEQILSWFFRIPGKRLRPALALLSAGMIDNNLGAGRDDQLMKLATALELIHNTSLIHDDIIDNDTVRRGAETINNAYGRKLAVLAGDVLYTKALSLMISAMPVEFTNRIIKLTEEMCKAEVEQAKEGKLTREKYLNIIRGKTAKFMSASCNLGGLLAGAKENEAESLSGFGLNFGMAFQITDDIIDEDTGDLEITAEDAECYANLAIKALGQFSDSPYKASLADLVTYVLGEPKAKQGIKSLILGGWRNEEVYSK